MMRRWRERGRHDMLLPRSSRKTRQRCLIYAALISLFDSPHFPSAATPIAILPLYLRAPRHAMSRSRLPSRKEMRVAPPRPFDARYALIF